MTALLCAPMTNLPKSAWIYWCATLVGGVVVVIGAPMLTLPSGVVAPWEYVIFALLAILFGGKKISVNKRRKQEAAMSMTLGFAITFASMIRMGPIATISISMLGCLSSCLYPRRQRWHQLSFNLALSSIEALAASATYLALNGWSLSLEPLRTFIAVSVSSLVFFLVNTLGVAQMISLCTSEKVVPIWKESFSWTFPSYVASACVGGLVMIVFHSSTSAIVLFILPVAYFVFQAFSTHLARVEDKRLHVEELRMQQSESKDVYLASIDTLARTIDAKGKSFDQNNVCVQRYAVAIAKAMGIEGAELQGVKTGALLFDIGKLGVPEHVLLKRGPLTPDEFDKVKRHSEIGAAILERVDFPSPVRSAVKHHHERWDGTGYPQGLKGEEIPVVARVIAVADVYHALTSHRTYRAANGHRKAVEIVRKGAGRQFDASIVDVFVRIIDPLVDELAKEGLGPFADRGTAPELMSSRSAGESKDLSTACSELWALYEFSQSISSVVGLKETAELVVNKIAGIYSDATCAFLLWNPNSESLTVDSVSGLNWEYFLGTGTRSSTSVSVQALKSKTSYFGPFQSEDLFFPVDCWARWTPLLNAVIVPVVHEGTLLGTINVYHASENALGEYDRQLLEMVGERSALAIYNGLRFDRARCDLLRDHLTGLYNRRYLLSFLDKQCVPGTEGSDAFSLLYLDLDSFKPINDGFGQLKGDEVLRDLASLFLEVVGSEGVVCRCGGDEFAIILPGFSQIEAEATSRRLYRAVNRYRPDLRHSTYGNIRVGVSVGSATYPQDAHDSAGLISVADSRMYIEKTERKLRQLAVN